MSLLPIFIVRFFYPRRWCDISQKLVWKLVSDNSSETVTLKRYRLMIYVLYVFREMGPQPVNKPVGVEKPTKCHYLFFLPWRTVEKKSAGHERRRRRAFNSILRFFTRPHGRASLLPSSTDTTTTQYYIKTVQRAHMLAGQRYSQDDTL